MKYELELDSGRGCETMSGECIAVLEKEVSKAGSSGHVYVPAEYVGRKVKIIVV